MNLWNIRYLLCTITLVDDNTAFPVPKPVKLYQTLYIGKQLFNELTISYPIEFTGLVFMYDNIVAIKEFPVQIKG